MSPHEALQPPALSPHPTIETALLWIGVSQVTKVKSYIYIDSNFGQVPPPKCQKA